LGLWEMTRPFSTLREKLCLTSPTLQWCCVIRCEPRDTETPSRGKSHNRILRLVSPEYKKQH
jgi:hypothetical protein